MSFITEKYYKEGEFYLERTSYAVNDNLAVIAYSMSGEDYGAVTVNIPGKSLEKDEAFLDENNVPDIGEVLERIGVAKNTGEVAHSGFCTYPKYKFDLEKIDAMYKEATE